MHKNEAAEIMRRFGVSELQDIIPFTAGHINNTFHIVARDGEYVLQQINASVFKSPAEVMENISRVTAHLKEKIAEEGGNPSRETLDFLAADNGAYFYEAERGAAFRAYRYISDVKTYQHAENPEMMASVGRAFGRFQRMLSDFDSDTLHETIKDFHNTPARYRQLSDALKEDRVGRAREVKRELEFAFTREKEAGTIAHALESGEIPLRVTHNDTKLSNVLIDLESGEGVCVIDLDTVMPGSLLYDFGDAIRSGTSKAREDESELSRVSFDIELYKAYTKGYLKELHTSITKREAELLPLSAKIITLECGVRFLTDYINGDEYFKTEYATQNLNRARVQFKMVADMEAALGDMEKITSEILKEYDK